MYHFIRSGYFLLVAGIALFIATAASSQDVPPATQVFSLDVAREDGRSLILRFDVAAGNYLYRDSIAATIDGHELQLALPAGEQKDDPNFGLVDVYHDAIQISLQDASEKGELSVRLQGCAEAGICYPPIVKNVDLETLAVADASVRQNREASVAFDQLDISPQTGNAAEVVIAAAPFAMFVGFLGFGLLLSFTPCVFPMIPILSSMLARAGDDLTALRGFALSSAYVLAMAAAYGLVGLVAGWSGANLQAALQTPWALGLSVAVFVALALSMFGFYELQLPAGLGNRLSQGRGGSLAGAALLGFGSALIVGPCVTPPLAAAMLYAIQTGEAARGTGALFALGLGMGLPLIAVGTFGVKILPKSGPWLTTVRQAFGVVFLCVAVMLASRLVPGPAALALWGVLAIGVSVFLGAFDRLGGKSSRTQRLRKAMGLVTALCGAVLVVGAAGGANDPFKPLAFASARFAVAAGPETRVTSVAAMERAIRDGSASGAPVLVSFSADWCTTCKSNEKVLEEPDIGARLKNVPTIIADVTAQADDQRALMSRFSVVGPPVLFFLDVNGNEIPGSRLVGPITADEIARRLDLAGA